MKIGVVGKLGYHEENITRPIIAALQFRGAECHRVVYQDVDFFTPEGATALPDLCRSMAEADFGRYDRLLLLDAWCLALPMLLWNLGFSRSRLLRPRLAGLLLGNVGLPYDVARQIPHAAHYETFLLDSMDLVICHNDWQLSRLHSESNRFRVLPHPMDLQAARERPFIVPSKTLVFPHRWSPDKGSHVFEAMAPELDKAGITCIAVESPPAVPYVTSRRRMSQDELKRLASGGGYVWAGTFSELAAYGVHDLVSYGMHPLHMGHPSFSHFPDRLKFEDVDDVIRIISEGRAYTSEEWDAWRVTQRDNAANIADAILEA